MKSGNLLLSSLLFLSCSAFADPNTLDSKLSEQWQRVEAARAEGLRVTEEGGTGISRDKWEKILKIAKPFTAEELKKLRARQHQLAAEARRQFQKKSLLDLEKLRQLPANKTQEFCAAFPKGGMLHLHPYGTMSEAAVSQILNKINPVLHAKILHGEFSNPKSGAILYPEELSFLLQLHSRYGKAARYLDLQETDKRRLQALFFLGSETHPFTRFQTVFALTSRWMLSNPEINPAPLMYEDFFSRAAAQHVTYVEFSEVGKAGAAWLNPLDTWAENARKRHGITARMLYAFLRILPSEDLAKTAQGLLALPPSKILLGVNIVADETHTPMLERGQSAYLPVEKAIQEKRSPLRLSSHAGELGDPRNVRDALLMGAERIGHGVKLREDPVTLEYARLRAIPVEANLTSNVRLRVVKSIAEHPFLHFLRLGLKVSLSTDDEGILKTDINHECELAVRETDMSYAELREMTLNSLSTAFASKEVIAPLQLKLEKDLQQFEKNWITTLKQTGS